MAACVSETFFMFHMYRVKLSARGLITLLMNPVTKIQLKTSHTHKK